MTSLDSLVTPVRVGRSTIGVHGALMKLGGHMSDRLWPEILREDLSHESAAAQTNHSTATSWLGSGSDYNRMYTNTTVGSIDIRRPDHFSIDRDDPFAGFAGRFGKELFKPGTQRC